MYREKYDVLKAKNVLATSVHSVTECIIRSFGTYRRNMLSYLLRAQVYLSQSSGYH
jgi:hypothetical protein